MVTFGFSIPYYFTNTLLPVKGLSNSCSFIGSRPLKSSDRLVGIKPHNIELDLKGLEQRYFAHSFLVAREFSRSLEQYSLARIRKPSNPTYPFYYLRQMSNNPQETSASYTTKSTPQKRSYLYMLFKCN